MAGRLHIDDWTRYPALPSFTRTVAPVLSPNLAPRRWFSLLRREQGELRLRDAFWGLTPSWLKVLDHAPHCARAESLETRAMFHEAFAERRCLVPVTGIFLWQAGLRGKQPFLVTRFDRAPLLLAGIWTRYALGDDASRDSCALITVPTSKSMAPLSDRLPAIIAPESIDAWLASDASSAKTLLSPAPRELLGAFPVSRRVNDPAHQEWADAYPIGPMRGQAE